MSTVVPNYPSNYGSMIAHSSQTPFYSSTPHGNEVVPNVWTTEFLEFSIQMAFGGMNGLNEATLMQRIQFLLVGKAPSVPLHKIWCYWAGVLNMEHTTLLVETKKWRILR